MNHPLTLDIFPHQSVALAIITCVWVGVCVVVFFHLRFGWTLSGLVVPGYLTPLLLVNPLSAAVIVGEAILCYGVVSALSRIRWAGYWSDLFGRDRFFAIVLVSILVRACFDGWILPAFGRFITEELGLQFDYQHQLHSYGLIVVSLIANYYWKPGLGRGSACLIVTCGATFAIVRYGLVEWTNFNITSLQFLYEEIAASLTASPSAYIVLLTTAWIASWLNQRYAWEFNGILIPALIALQWHHPTKVLVTLIESGVILTVASLLLKLPLWKRVTMEGGRKTLFFFHLAFAYRYLLAWCVPLLIPGAKVSDWHGLGYLLTALLAVRCHDRGRPLRLVRSTVQASLVGVVVGSAMGFALTHLPAWPIAAPVSRPGGSAVTRTSRGLLEVLRADKLLLYHQQQDGRGPTADEVEAFTRGLRQLQAYRGERSGECLEAAGGLLAAAGFELTMIRDRYLYLRESAPPRGWGLFVIDLQGETAGPAIGVPDPHGDLGIVESGHCLFAKLNGRTLAIGGAGHQRLREADGSPGAVYYSVFHQLQGAAGLLEVRSMNWELARKICNRGSLAQALKMVEQGRDQLWVKRGLPPGCNLKQLQQLIPDLQVHWEPSPTGNPVRDRFWSRHTELVLSRQTRRKLLARLVERVPGRQFGRSLVQRTALAPWLLGLQERLAGRGTNQYVPAQLQELQYLDVEVLAPLLQLADQVPRRGRIAEHLRERLRPIDAAAEVLDYRASVLADTHSGENFLVLQERQPQRRFWGTYVLRCSAPEDFVWQVPRPMYERQSWEFAVTMFTRTGSAGLLLAGAHPRANTDGTADPIRLSNRESLFNLVHQVGLRHWTGRSMLVIQTRAIQDPVAADVVIATTDGLTPATLRSAQQHRLLTRLEENGFSTAWVDGSETHAGYELGHSAQALAMSLSDKSELVSLWLSPRLRSLYRCHDEDSQTLDAMELVGIPVLHGRLLDDLDQWRTVAAASGSQDPGDHPAPQLAAARGRVAAPAAVSDTAATLGDLRAHVESYLKYRDVVQLHRLRVRAGGWKLACLLDRDSQAPFLLLQPPGPQAECWIVNLAGSLHWPPRTVSAEAGDRAALARFLESRAAWCRLLPASPASASPASAGPASASRAHRYTPGGAR